MQWQFGRCTSGQAPLNGSGGINYKGEGKTPERKANL